MGPEIRIEGRLQGAWPKQCKYNDKGYPVRGTCGYQKSKSWMEGQGGEGLEGR